MSKFLTKKFFSIMLFVMLFFVLTNAVRNDLKKRQALVQGQPCNDPRCDKLCTDSMCVTLCNDSLCDTGICRIKGEDTHKCQITDQRDEGEPCLQNGNACKVGLSCQSNICRSG
ncbi:hypothetical protein C2G38_2031448 [Gigaspora rosea]|uniref:Uncharacterized protein n=1 Tax=Gigaspora rosea TaxID=44941 RepID=A0A397VSV4_9GLOM|nr:hypothetical protein C2G38_2031448 [Gigaspora rosea]